MIIEFEATDSWAMDRYRGLVRSTFKHGLHEKQFLLLKYFWYFL